MEALKVEGMYVTSKKIISEIPEDLQKVFFALKDENRSKIFLTIYNDEDRDLSFSNLKRKLKMNSNLLANSLNILQQAQLVENQWKKIPERSDHSFYKTTYFSKRFVEAMIGFMETIIEETVHFEDYEKTSSFDSSYLMVNDEFEPEIYFKSSNRLVKDAIPSLYTKIYRTHQPHIEWIKSLEKEVIAERLPLSIPLKEAYYSDIV